MVSSAGGSARTRLPCPNATSAGGVPLPNTNGGSLAEYERSSQMKLWTSSSSACPSWGRSPRTRGSGRGRCTSQ
jgi:hypothetical protein